MGQKVNPIANRLGITRGWDSNWFGGKDFSEKLVEDAKIRKYLNVRLAKASISKIIIERTLKLVTVTISTARPGIIIGKGGQEVDKLEGGAEEAHRQGGSDQHLRGEASRGRRRHRRSEHRPSAGGPRIVPPRREDRPWPRPCAWVPRVSRFRLPAVWAVPRWPAPRPSRRVVLRCTPFRADVDYCLTEALTKVGILGVEGVDLPGHGLRQARSVRDRRAHRPSRRRATAVNAVADAAATVAVTVAEDAGAATVATTNK